MDVPRPPKPHLRFDFAEIFASGERCVNGTDLPRETHEDLRPWLIDDLFARESCAFCHAPLQRAVAFSDEFEERQSDEGSLAEYRWRFPYPRRDVVLDESEYLSTNSFSKGNEPAYWDLFHCTNCAHWGFLGKYPHDTLMGMAWEATLSVARTFEDSLPEGLERELAQALRRETDRWKDFDPTRLERFVGSVVKANYEPCQVMHLGRTRDGGVDLFLRDGAGQEWVIQVKRRSNARGEEVDTVRRLLGVMYEDLSLKGIVVTTANHFTRDAIAHQLDAAPDALELVDRGKLNEMLSPLLPERPWRSVAPQLPDELWGTPTAHLLSELERRIER